MHAILTDALETLEAEWEVLSGTATGADFALQLLQFLSVMRRDPTISVLLDEVRSDEQASLRDFDDTEAAVCAGIGSMLSRLPAVPSDTDSVPPEEAPGDARPAASPAGERVHDRPPSLDETWWEHPASETDNDERD